MYIAVTCVYLQIFFCIFNKILSYLLDLEKNELWLERVWNFLGCYYHYSSLNSRKKSLSEFKSVPSQKMSILRWDTFELRVQNDGFEVLNDFIGLFYLEKINNSGQKLHSVDFIILIQKIKIYFLFTFLRHFKFVVLVVERRLTLHCKKRKYLFFKVEQERKIWRWWRQYMLNNSLNNIYKCARTLYKKIWYST